MDAMSHFTSDFNTFFNELVKNNNKAWFDQNRKRYEKAVKVTFTRFVEEMIVRIHAANPDVLIEPGEAIFRINRDIRFSKDKTPYKTHMAALISPGGRKAKELPGFYFQLGVDGIRIYCGVHMLDKNLLEKVRIAISADLSGFAKILECPEFKSKFGEVQGSKYKRIPPEHAAAAEKQPLIANKDLYMTTNLDQGVITKPDLAEILMEQYFVAKPLIDFLTNALNN